MCTEEEIDAGGKFIKEQNDLKGQISELIEHTIQHITEGQYRVKKNHTDCTKITN